jgi:hypothetical protein
MAGGVTGPVGGGDSSTLRSAVGGANDASVCRHPQSCGIRERGKVKCLCRTIEVSEWENIVKTVFYINYELDV